MKKRKLKKLLAQALQQLAVMQLPAGQPVEKPAANDPAPAVEGPTVAEWLVTYRTIIGQRGYNPQTVKNRTTSINHIQTAWGEMKLRAVRPVDISTALKQWSPHTAVRVLGELRDVYVEAIANGVADTSPAAHVKRPKAPGLRKRLTLETWQAMLNLARHSNQRWVPALLLLALATGQRRGDLVKMKFSDVVDGHLRVEQQKKAGKPTGARVAIPLSLRLAATGMTLGEVIEQCKTIGAPGETLLRKAGGGPIEMSSLSARFRQLIVKACGPDAYQQYEWPSLHEARSLSARTYMAEGMTEKTVQDLLGHKAAEMTQLYLNDRGLTDGEWKQVAANDQQPIAA